MNRCVASILMTGALAAAGCGGEGSSPGDAGGGREQEPAAQAPRAAPRPGDAGAGTVLAARFGKAPLLLGEIKFKPAGGGELEIEIDNATPGSVHAVTIDGAPLGELRIDLEGEGDLNLAGAGFPAGLAGLRAGSVIVVGNLFQGTLQPLEKLVNLGAILDPGGGVVGEAGYKVERLGETLTRELEIDLQGRPEMIYAVSLDGVSMGQLALDDEGKGEIKFSDFDGAPFPAGFVEPGDGSLLRIGRLEARMSGR